MKHTIQVTSSNPPVVECDSQACAAYIRFSRNSVDRTEVITTEGAIATMDIDSSGEVVGIELIGVTEFSIEALAKISGIELSKSNIRQAQYVPTSSSEKCYA